MDKCGRDYKQATRKDVRLALDTETFLPADVSVFSSPGTRALNSVVLANGEDYVLMFANISVPVVSNCWRRRAKLKCRTRWRAD